MRFLLMLVLPFLMTACGCTQVETGTVGIERYWKEVKSEALSAGLHFYNPISTDIELFNIKEQKFDVTTPCYTRDTQTASITMSVNASINPAKAIELYSKVQHEWPNVILSPIILATTKDTIGQYNADELIAKRSSVSSEITEKVLNRLAEYGIVVHNISFTNIDFNDAYEAAIEAKVVAVQKAAEAKNKTVEIEEQSKQRIIQAEAEAKAIAIQTEALSKSKSLIEFEAVKKWNGVLPQYMLGNGTVPMMSLPSTSAK